MSEANKKVLKDVWMWIKYACLPPTVIWFVYHEVLFEWVGNRPYFVLVALGAALNACMDVVTHHYDSSIFKNKDPFFFDPDKSWIKRYKQGKTGMYDLDNPKKILWVFDYPFSPDFWHYSKSLMVVSLAFAICLYNPYVFWVDFLFVGYIWNTVFGLFYDKILRKG